MLIHCDMIMNLSSWLTVSSGDITDNVNLIHGDLPVSLFLREAHGPRLVPLSGVTLNSQKHWALEVHKFQISTTVYAQHCV